MLMIAVRVVLFALCALFFTAFVIDLTSGAPDYRLTPTVCLSLMFAVAGMVLGDLE